MNPAGVKRIDSKVQLKYVAACRQPAALWESYKLLIVKNAVFRGKYGFFSVALEINSSCGTLLQCSASGFVFHALVSGLFNFQVSFTSPGPQQGLSISHSLLIWSGGAAYYTGVFFLFVFLFRKIEHDIFTH